MRDDDEVLLLEGTDDTLDDSPVVVEYFKVDEPDGDDLESEFEILEELMKN
jgi:hypothetical protein